MYHNMFFLPYLGVASSGPTNHVRDGNSLWREPEYNHETGGNEQASVDKESRREEQVLEVDDLAYGRLRGAVESDDYRPDLRQVRVGIEMRGD